MPSSSPKEWLICVIGNKCRKPEEKFLTQLLPQLA